MTRRKYQYSPREKEIKRFTNACFNASYKLAKTVLSAPKTSKKSATRSNYLSNPSLYSSSRSSYRTDFSCDVEMDRTGRITYTFRDRYGELITDEQEYQRCLRRLKQQYDYKEKLAKLNKDTCDEVNQETEVYTDVYKKTPPIIEQLDAEIALGKLSPQYYSTIPFNEAAPDKDRIKSRLEYVAQQQIKSILWWTNKKKREKYVEEQTPIVYEKRLREWEAKKRDFESEQARIKEEKDAEYLQEYNEKKNKWESFLSSDENRIIEGLQNEVARLYDTIPGGFGLDVIPDIEHSTLFVEVDLPEVEEIPTIKATLLASGKASFKQKTQKEVQSDYLKCICGVAIYIAGNIFNVNALIKNVQVSGYTQRMNKAIGDYDDEYVFSVFFDRHGFSVINTQNIDPYIAMREFPCRIKASVTGVLSTIVPFPIPGDDDYKPDEMPQLLNSNMKGY